MRSLTNRVGIFYGWWVAAGVFGLLLNIGGSFYSFGVLFKPLMLEFGCNRAQVSLGHSGFVLASAIAGVGVGKLIERFGSRRIILIGAVLGAGGYFLLSAIQCLWQFYFLYFFSGCALSAAGLIPSAALLSNWFTERRGTAIGISMAGVSVGALLFVPMVDYGVGGYGWRSGYAILGVCILLIDIPVAVFVLKDSPIEIGLLPDGAKESGRENGNSDLPRPERSMEGHGQRPDEQEAVSLFRSAGLWLLCVGFFLNNAGEMGILLHQVPFFTDVGIPAAVAAAAVALTGAVGAIGKVVFGRLTDLMHTRNVVILCFAFQALGVLILPHTRSMNTLLVFIVLFGFSMGGALALIPLSVADLFPRRSFGTIYGWVHFAALAGSMVGPPFAGFVHDITGSYALAFMVFLGTYGIAIVCVYLAWSGSRTCNSSNWIA